MTSPSWFLVLAGSKIVFPNADIVLLARLWSLFFLVGSSVLLFRILQDRMPGIALFSPLPVFFMPSMPGLAGHETALALFSNLLLIWAFMERRRILFPVAAVAAYLARGEAAIFAVVLGLAYVCPDGTMNRQIITKTKELAVGLVIALAIFILWHGYHYVLTGSIFADTFSAKTLQANSGRWPLFVVKVGRHFQFTTGPLGGAADILLLLFSLFGLWITWRHVWPLAVWPLVHYWTLTALGLPWYHWYYYPIEFGIIIGFVASGAFTASFIGRHFRVISGMLPQVAIILVICIVAIAPLRRGLVDISGKLRETSWMTAMGATPHPTSRFAIYREFAGWIARNHAKPAAPIILTHEVGILGYYLPDALLYDVVGLASPAESTADMYNYGKYVGLYAPDFILRYHFGEPPNELVYQLSSGGTVRYVVGITRRRMASDIELSMYRLDSADGTPNRN